MRLDIAPFAPDSEFALLTDQQVKSALAEREINAIAGEVHRLTSAYAQAWMAQLQAEHDGGEEIDAAVIIAGATAPIERIALELMAQMAVDAIGEPLKIAYEAA